jgi:hypothetical protein
MVGLGSRVPPSTVMTRSTRGPSKRMRRRACRIDPRGAVVAGRIYHRREWLRMPGGVPQIAHQSPEVGPWGGAAGSGSGNTYNKSDPPRRPQRPAGSRQSRNPVREGHVMANPLSYRESRNRREGNRQACHRRCTCGRSVFVPSGIIRDLTEGSVSGPFNPLEHEM